MTSHKPVLSRIMPSLGVALVLVAYAPGMTRAATVPDLCQVEAATAKGREKGIQDAIEMADEALSRMGMDPANNDYGNAAGMREQAQGCLFDAAQTMGTIVKNGGLGGGFFSTVLDSITEHMRNGSCMDGGGGSPRDADSVANALPDGAGKDLYAYVPGGLAGLIDLYYPGGENGFVKQIPGGVTEIANIDAMQIHGFVAQSIYNGVVGAIDLMIDNRPNGLNEFLGEIGGTKPIIDNLPREVVMQIPRDPMNPNILLIDEYPGGIRALIDQLPDAGADNVVNRMSGKYNKLIDRIPQQNQKQVIDAIASRTPGGIGTIVRRVPNGEQKVVDAAGGMQAILNKYAHTATHY